jgi:hypothetical protein
MKFVFDGSKMVLANGYLGGKPDPGSLMDHFNQFSDWAIGKQVELIFKPLGLFLQQAAINAWHWFIVNLPDIIGYGTIATGVIIILSAMAGKGIIKPLGWYAGALILAVCILGSI